MIYLMIVPALIALVTGFLVSKKFLLNHVKKHYLDSISIQNRRIYLFFGIIGGLSMILPAHFLSIVFGGTMGGGYGSIIGGLLGTEKLGFLSGMAVGIYLVALIVIMFGVFAGSLIGDTLVKIRPKPYLFYSFLLLVFVLFVYFIKSTIPILWM